MSRNTAKHTKKLVIIMRTLRYQICNITITRTYSETYFRAHRSSKMYEIFKDKLVRFSLTFFPCIFIS